MWAPFVCAQSSALAMDVKNVPSLLALSISTITSKSVTPVAIPSGKDSPPNMPEDAASTPATSVPCDAGVSLLPVAASDAVSALQPDRAAQCCALPTFELSAGLSMPLSRIATFTPLPVRVLPPGSARSRASAAIVDLAVPTDLWSSSSPSPILWTLPYSASSARRASGTVAVTKERDSAFTMSVAPISPSALTTASLFSPATASGSRPPADRRSTMIITLRAAGTSEAPDAPDAPDAPAAPASAIHCCTLS